MPHNLQGQILQSCIVITGMSHSRHCASLYLARLISAGEYVIVIGESSRGWRLCEMEQYNQTVDVPPMSTTLLTGRRSLLTCLLEDKPSPGLAPVTKKSDTNLNKEENYGSLSTTDPSIHPSALVFPDLLSLPI